MTRPEIGMPGVTPLPNSPGMGGPCAPARSKVDTLCVEAERLAATAQSRQRTLREARRQHAEATRRREADVQLRDRRRVAGEKAAAQAEYRAALLKATNRAAVQEAAAIWLRRVDEINRQASQAGDEADQLGQRAAELARMLPGLELAADAARITAEVGRVACLDARRTLAACEEDAARRMPGSGARLRVPASPAIRGAALRERTDAEGVAAAARALVRGDRQTLLALAQRLAEESGLDAGRLQLLLLELREQIEARAKNEFAFSFPDNHAFWSQFEADVARDVAASLSSMGYRFDGAGGWANDRVPRTRDLALALADCGLDPRSLRRPPSQADIDALWQGTKLRTEDYLLAGAPDLTLGGLDSLLGPSAGRLAELWDIWGRLRPLLMRVA